MSKKTVSCYPLFTLPIVLLVLQKNLHCSYFTEMLSIKIQAIWNKKFPKLSAVISNLHDLKKNVYS